ncbi:FtsK/SpoIIIE domain-containing protein [Mycobacterium palustre]|uniref:Cell division protein FtsK n=1 Tax=Mycobacterium palustre TaxID=153971 RepID=A0A1X1ZL36_9MYCO|nr:cell division protein FtsK [Mycobacterium palustre]
MNPYDPTPIDPGYPYPDAGFSFEHLEHLALVGAAWLLVLVAVMVAALLTWRHNDPQGYERYFAGPLRRARWRWWVRGSWSRLSKRCGLSFSEQVTSKDKDGKPTTTTVWTHPKLVRINTSDHCLYLTVRTRMGQTVEDLENAVPKIRDAAGAHSARSAVVAPGTVRMEFVMREQLAGVGYAPPPTRAATTSVRLGRCENGKPWTLRIAGRHTLTVGCSGSGKGSVFWGIAAGFGPAVSAGLVHLVGIDLKYGIEVSVGAGLFTKVATTEEDAVNTLAALEKLMDARGAKMAGNSREHTPTVVDPLVVLLIDELAGVTAYMSDPALRKQAGASLSRILTKGRALGVVVAAFLQDPRKEVLPMRGLFTQTIALRLRSRDEVAMVLGDGLVDAAPAHRISPDAPGTGYVIAEDGSAMRVRADFWSDAQIRDAAARYHPPKRNTQSGKGSQKQ